jgi:fatty acid desaturase
VQRLAFVGQEKGPFEIAAKPEWRFAKRQLLVRNFRPQWPPWTRSRVILACLALFIIWTLVRAARSGIVYSRGVSFNAEQSPMLFALVVLCHAGGVVFFLALAAGFTLTEIKHFVLLGLNLPQ